MIPFRHTVPYETIRGDLYVQECPFCRQSNVLLPLKAKHLQAIREGSRRLIVFPCCHEKFTALDADGDYLLADRPLRL